jgi:hypothetical protein
MAESVIVMCKLPCGLELQVADKRVKLRGSAVYMQPNPKRKLAPQEIVYVDSLNVVDKKFWEDWNSLIAKNFADPYTAGKHTFAPLLPGPNGEEPAIYVAKDRADATAKAKDMAKVRCGFEQLIPSEHGVKDADGK